MTLLFPVGSGRLVRKYIIHNNLYNREYLYLRLNFQWPVEKGVIVGRRVGRWARPSVRPLL